MFGEIQSFNDTGTLIECVNISRLAQLVERVTSMLRNDEVSRSSRLMGRFLFYFIVSL